MTSRSATNLPRPVRYVVAGVVLLLLDAAWLGLIATPLYDAQLGSRLAEQPNLAAAAAFYLLYLLGVVHFVVDPALAAGSWRRAAATGGFFGLVAYATWGLTNAAVLADWPSLLVPVDLAWGALLTSVTAAVTVALLRGRLRSVRRHAPA